MCNYFRPKIANFWIFEWLGCGVMRWWDWSIVCAADLLVVITTQLLAYVFVCIMCVLAYINKNGAICQKQENVSMAKIFLARSHSTISNHYLLPICSITTPIWSKMTVRKNSNFHFLKFFLKKRSKNIKNIFIYI